MGRGQQLYYAEADALRVAEVLDHLGDVPSRRTEVLLSPTAGQLRAALEDLREDVAASRAGGAEHVTVLFFYSGHADPNAVRLGNGTVPYAEVKEASPTRGPTSGSSCKFLLRRRRGERRGLRAPGFLRDASAGDARGEVVITSSAADEASQESDG